ncbi:MAG: flagellar basal body-associated FliL family protein [Candidatus Paracaedibacteraceae bacterium]|nr:flagellar basal body-associated FliL family protein [Candidatus Paracaedibacteraceae bacterium]
MAEEKENASLPTSSDGGKGKIIIIGVLVLLIVVAAGLFFTPVGASLLGHKEPVKEEVKKEESAASELDVTKVAFTTLPEILLNLRNTSGKSSFLKVTFIVQSPTEEVGKKVEKLKPILINQFQEYLRGLDIEDLAGSAGLQRVRNELLTRTNNILAPDKASDILIGPFLIQ